MTGLKFNPPIGTVMGMDGTTFGMTVLVTLLGGTLIAAVLKFIVDRKTLPITREQMLAAASQASVDMALRNSIELDRRLSAVEQDMRALKRAYNVLLRWAHDVVNRWHVHRQSESPPDLPVEALLDSDEPAAGG